MMESKCRKAFEAWYSNNDPNCPSIIKNPDGSYRFMQAHSAYETWFACWQHCHPPITSLETRWETCARRLSCQTLSESDALWSPEQWYKKMIAAWHK